MFLKIRLGSLISNPWVIKTELLMSLLICVSLFPYEKDSEFPMISNWLVIFMFPYVKEMMLVRHVWIVPNWEIRSPFHKSLCNYMYLCLAWS